MKNIYILLVALSLITASCIDWGLDTLPVYHDAELLDFGFEYRYVVNNNNGIEQMAVEKLNSAVTISDNNILVKISIPSPNSTFTPEVANQINLSNIIGYTNISIGATIEPLDGAPQLGNVGNFSIPVKYKVTAADEITEKIYTISVSL